MFRFPTICLFLMLLWSLAKSATASRIPKFIGFASNQSRLTNSKNLQLAADSLGLECHECVLVDDSMLNVHGARDQGMHGIKVIL